MVYARAYYAANSQVITARERERYAANREDILRRKRELYLANRELILAQKREWRDANPEKVRQYITQGLGHPEDKKEYDRIRYAMNREIVKARSRAWHLAHPEKVRQSDAKRRALKLQAPFEDFADTEIFGRDGWRCGLCGGQVDPSLKWPDVWSVSLDHIVPLSKGGSHTRGNVQCTHVTCNVHKAARLLDNVPQRK